MIPKNSKMLMTVPTEAEEYRPYFLTGNEYISLPEIGPENGGIYSLNVIRMDSRALLEFRGAEKEPLLKPTLQLNGKKVDLGNRLSWNYRRHWIPHFYLQDQEWELRGEIFTPPGYRGGLYQLSLTNKTPRPLNAVLGWEGVWDALCYTIFNQRPVNGPHRIYFDNWTQSLVLEAYSGFPLVALALAPDEGRIQSLHLDKTSPSPLAYSSATPLQLASGETGRVTLYMAVNLEGDGAGTTLVDLKRHGAEKLIHHAEKWLEEHALALPIKNPHLESILNRNLFFNYFYATGRALDSSQLLALTSRSPRYYVSAAFWSRDALLWSFPGLLLVDKTAARELLLGIFERHLAAAGDHAHYLNGAVLYPGFELDQLAAYPLALRLYLEETGDEQLLQEDPVRQGIKIVLEKMRRWQDPVSELYGTFLDPSDDPVSYPYLIYNNVLAWCALQFMGSLQENKLWESEHNCALLANSLYQAINTHGIVSGPNGPIYAWAVDAQGNYQLYDNPPGSLQLLAHYGFCRKSDLVYQNTVRWIRSEHNPCFYTDAPFKEASSHHARKPWPIGAANDLLALNEGAESFLSQITMDNSFMCETVDHQTGQASTGLAFASAAGFLAYALWQRYRKTTTPEAKEA